MSRYIDITVPVHPGMTVWPGAPSPRFDRRCDMERGADVNDSDVFFNLHSGTHVDAPSHFVRGGGTADDLSLSTLIGSAYVAEVPSEIDCIDGDVLEALEIPAATKRLLLRTRNSDLWRTKPEEFVPDFVAMTKEGASWLVRRGIELVGIDYLSIQRFHDGPEAHVVLLEAGVIILEGTDLSDVAPGWYELICLPMKLKGLEGAPVRALLRELSE
jgi:arylformamidase